MGDVFSRLRTALAGRYTLKRELGRGGMATVWLAHDLKHDRPVALKVLRPELAAALGPERFLREVQITARLNHPHILPLLDSGEAAGFLYYVMPYVEGESLRDRLRREKQLSLDDALQVACEVADALSYAHAHGVVHRDIKPENILLESGHALVADFGIAKALTSVGGDRLTETGIAVGTPAYMSPEQATGSMDLDGRSDLYSLGCVVYEMLAGHPPFTGSTTQEPLARHSMDAVPRLSAARSAVPEAVEDAVERALAKTPADRFTTAHEFSDALRSGTTTSARRPTRRRLGRLMAAAGSLAVVLAAVVGWFTWTGRPGTLFATGGISPGDRVLLADFTNLTDDTTLAYAVREGVRTLLTDPGLVRLVDPANVRETLVRMGRPPDTPLGDAIAREVAERADAKALLAGEVSRLGSGYQFTASVLQTADGAELLRERVTARSLDEVIDAVDRLGGKLRRGLGESLRRALARPALAQVTTASLPALRAYSDAVRLVAAGQVRQALAPLDQAIGRDSGFAMAYRLKGVVLGRFGVVDRAEQERLFERAYHLRDRLPEIERLMVTATYFSTRRDPRYEATLHEILDLDSRNGWALNNLSDVRLEQRRLAEAESLALRALDASERSNAAVASTAYGNAVEAQVAQGRFGAAESTMRRLAEWNPAAWRGIRAHYLLARRDYVAVLALADSLRSVPGFDSTAFSHMVEAAVLAQGRLRQARPPRSALLRHGVPARLSIRYGGDSIHARAEIDSLRRHLRWDTLPPSRRPNAMLIAALAEAGLAAEARRLLEECLSVAVTDSAVARQLPEFQGAAEGAIAMAEGRFADAASAYLVWNAAPFTQGYHPFSRGLFEAGWAMDRLGRTDSALALYRRSLSQTAMGDEFSEVLWYPLVLRRLGELYEARGDRDKTMDYYGRFVSLWAAADPNLQPQVAEIRRRLARLASEPELTPR